MNSGSKKAGSINKKRKSITKIIYNSNSIYIMWGQAVNEKEKLLGIGYFSIMDKEIANERDRRCKEQNLEKEEKVIEKHTENKRKIIQKK